MYFFSTIETVDITKELPIEFWIGFILIMAVILPLASKLLKHLFIPKPGREEAPIWDRYDKKTPKY